MAPISATTANTTSVGFMSLLRVIDAAQLVTETEVAMRRVVPAEQRHVAEGDQGADIARER
jgi:hypothetical protein